VGVGSFKKKIGCDFLPQFEHACRSSEEPQVRKKKKVGGTSQQVQQSSKEEMVHVEDTVFLRWQHIKADLLNRRFLRWSGAGKQVALPPSATQDIAASAPLRIVLAKSAGTYPGVLQRSMTSGNWSSPCSDESRYHCFRNSSANFRVGV
jgi:hypothetical protein